MRGSVIRAVVASAGCAAESRMAQLVAGALRTGEVPSMPAERRYSSNRAFYTKRTGNEWQLREQDVERCIFFGASSDSNR